MVSHNSREMVPLGVWKEGIWRREEWVFERLEEGPGWEGLPLGQLSPGRWAVWHW